MKQRLITHLLFALLATGIVGPGSAASDDSFWVGYWSHPKPILYGAEEEAFYQNLKEVAFARNEYNRAVNPEALDDDARWLKEHPNIKFYIDGYASKRGDQDYNLRLAQLRAEWVKQSLIKRGINESRIKLAVGWGELYPTCLEESDECLARNKVVRLTYIPAR
jgi:outer membrane protein OmpA-like peptidoglycan-associated protein